MLLIAPMSDMPAVVSLGKRHSDMRQWAVVDDGRTIHIEDAACPADVMASTHGHGTHGPVGVAYRDHIGDDWTAL